MHLSSIHPYYSWSSQQSVNCRLSIGNWWFTLIELIIAMGVFAIMSVTVLSVYIQTMNVSHKLQATRYLTETAREITDRIQSDVRDRGIAESSDHTFDPSTTHTPWMGQSYTSGGGEVMMIRWGEKYVFGRRNATNGLAPCLSTDSQDISIHCGLYLVGASDTTGGQAVDLADSFIPDESRKRVKVTDARFWISGDANTEKKVTLLFTIALTPQTGVPPSMIESSRMTIQTIFSERKWKKY